MTDGRRHIDIPINLIPSEREDWVPRKATDPEEIARREKMRPGTLRYQHQALGLDVIRAVTLFPYSDPNSRKFANEWSAVPLLVSAWYMYGSDKVTSDIHQRRVSHLAVLATDVGGTYRATRDELREQSEAKTTIANTKAHSFAVDYYLGKDTLGKQRALGKALSNAAMMFAAIDLDSPEDVSAKTIQDYVFLDATKLQTAASISHKKFSVPASVAQLSDPISPLSIKWKEEAPHEAKHALIEAQSVFGIPE